MSVVEALVLALRARGVDDIDLRHCVHEASHALDAKMRGPWSNTAVSNAMKRLGPGRAARSELLARAVEQLVCKRLGVETKSLDYWVGMSVLEAIKYRDPFLDHEEALAAAERLMKTAEAQERAAEILALAAKPAKVSATTGTCKKPPRQQCAKCPWKVGTDPNEIPGEYSAEKHAALDKTIATPGDLRTLGTLRMMACHETDAGRELPCVGWLVHQLGPGNNLGLRLRVMSGQVDGNVRTVGPQHERFGDTLPRQMRPKRKAARRG